MKKFILNYLEDIFILSGLTLIVIATFIWSEIAGIYAMGVTLLGIGIYFAKYPPRGR